MVVPTTIKFLAIVGTTTLLDSSLVPMLNKATASFSELLANLQSAKPILEMLGLGQLLGLVLVFIGVVIASTATRLADFFGGLIPPDVWTSQETLLRNTLSEIILAKHLAEARAKLDLNSPDLYFAISTLLARHDSEIREGTEFNNRLLGRSSSYYRLAKFLFMWVWIYPWIRYFVSPYTYTQPELVRQWAIAMVLLCVAVFLALQYIYYEFQRIQQWGRTIEKKTLENETLNPELLEKELRAVREFRKTVKGHRWFGISVSYIWYWNWFADFVLGNQQLVFRSSSQKSGRTRTQKGKSAG